MKAQFLKISGHKNEKDFYKEFPTYESFMAKHGAKLKKAQGGAQMTDVNKNGIPDYLERPQENEYTALDTSSQQFGSALNKPMFGPQTNPTPTARFQKPEPNTDYFDPSTVISPYQKTNADIMGERSAMIGEQAQAAQKATVDPNKFSSSIGMLDSVVNGFKALNSEKKALKSAKAWNFVSKVSRRAAETEDVNKDQIYADNAKRTRKALMPTVTGEELFPVYGVGTNSLGQSKHGTKMKKAKSGEIMNTYAPGDIYDDLGYEPLGESTFQPLSDQDVIKAYRAGGLVRAQTGGSFNFGSMFSSMGGASGASGMMGGSGSMNPYAAAADSILGPATSNMDSGGGQIGAGIGEAAGTAIGGPVGGMIGKYAGKFLGNSLDKNPGRIKSNQKAMMKNINVMSGLKTVKGIRTGYAGSLEDGGNVNPRVIKYFGNNTVSSLLKPDPMMDTLRTGGNLRQNDVGDVEAVSGGYLEPISYNPHTSGSGITSMIRGQSHDESNGRHSGVIMDFNGSQVEAERGEPISERQDGGSVGDTSAVIAGDQTFNKLGSKLMPHLNKYEGKKIKNIQKEIAEKDAKLNKFEAKNSIALKEFEPKTPIDKLTFNSLTKNSEGIQQKYKINANEVNDLLAYQQAVNDTAHIMNADAGDLSRGKIKYVSKDTTSSSAAYGMSIDDEELPKLPLSSVKNTKAMKEYPAGQHKGEKFYGSVDNVEFEIMKKENPWFDWDTFDPTRKGDTERFQKSFNKLSESLGSNARLNVDDQFGEQTASARIDLKGNKPTPVIGNASTVPTVDKQNPNYEVTPYNGVGFDTLAGQLLPWFRKTPGEELSGDQLAGEMMALTEDVDPVQARFYHPNLRTPYDISYQDQLNENQADFNQLTRAAGANPEALSSLAGQKYMANSKVLGEQFRANQDMKEKIYSGNTSILNDALLKNLSLADQQYVRQSQAKSNTKEIRRAAVESIASKIQENRLENRKLQVGSNEFADFSYDNSMRLRKTGAPTSFYIPQNYTPDTSAITHVPMYDKNGRVVGMQEVEAPSTRKQPSTKNGGLVKAFKNL